MKSRNPDSHRSTGFGHLIRNVLAQWRRFFLAPPVFGAGVLVLAGCGKQDATVAESPHISAMNRGVSLMGQYQYDAAGIAFQEALKAQPQSKEAQLNLAIALFNRNRKEDVEESARLLDQVLRNHPKDSRALYFKAIMLQHVGRAQDAIPLLQQVLEQHPRDGVVWYLLGLCKQRTGQPSENELLKAVEFRPYLYGAYYQLYQSALRAGKEREAAEFRGKFEALRQSPLGEVIELPQYNQMGDLALVASPPGRPVVPIASSRYSAGALKVLHRSVAGTAVPPSPQAGTPQGCAAGDLDGDGRPDLVLPLGAPRPALVLMQKAPGEFADRTQGSGLESITSARNVAIGDFDNDRAADLLIAGEGDTVLLKGKGDGTFSAVPLPGVTGTANATSTLFTDADHDGDLDLLICSSSPVLLRNNGDGTFTNAVALPSSSPAGAETEVAVLAVPGDVDRDRDHDLLLSRKGQPARLLMNELLGSFAERGLDTAIRGERGVVLQDLNGDGVLDLAALGGNPARLSLWLGDGLGGFRVSEAFAGVATSAASWGDLHTLRAADLDLDGDLDLLCSGEQVHALLNDGRATFVLQHPLTRTEEGFALHYFECADLSGDFIPDILTVEGGASGWRVCLREGGLTPPPKALAIQPTGVRNEDKRTRSPATGFGVTLTLRTGMTEQHRFYTGLSGGPSQSWLPVVFGLGGAPKADYLMLNWPDGVAQSELGLAAGELHPIPELQRKISSCPVLFAWNGERFVFVTDFAGVGGLGYFSAPGVPAPPQELEHVKIEPGQLRPRDGNYELRITEPMEEAAYVDRLELVAVDHPCEWSVYPDERLAISGPPPTHQLLVVQERKFAVSARDPGGNECSPALRNADRLYAYKPDLDRRYSGFCKPHALELDFGDGLSGLSGADRVFLFLNGYIEYPYSQTVYAASQSRIGWEPIRIECQAADGSWQTIVADAGAPGGMGRMMTVDLTGLIPAGARSLRLTTNLEIYYDQVFLSQVLSANRVMVRTAPLNSAELRRVGFAREYSPDGRLPLVFDYHLSDATAPFHVLKGHYTRYGAVEELLASADDRFAIMGPGDEIALRFSAVFPALPEGWARSFILVSHAYCKDMDLYTATPRTLDPLPFKSMSRYPYPASERPPSAQADYVRAFNTRVVE